MWRIGEAKLNGNTKKSFYSVVIAWGILTAVFVSLAFNKLTYVEFTTKNLSAETCSLLSDTNADLSVSFYSPYNRVRGFSFPLLSADIDSNTHFSLNLCEKNTGRLVLKKDVVSNYVRGDDWIFIDFEKNIWLEKSINYEITILAKESFDNKRLAFSVPPENVSVRIHGGNFDVWWLELVLVCSLFFLLMILRCFALCRKNVPIYTDKIFVSMVICALVFALSFFFKDYVNFIDESDNMNGGLLIAYGRVLYRDYVTQHTPFAYYVCGLFALFGAKSTEQFRLSYYILEGLVFGFLYIRHSDYFGRVRMFFLPLLEIVALYALVSGESRMILSDGIEGICFIALLLEFLRYCKDGRIDCGRVIIVSLCVWFSFGSAFVSAYALLWIFLAVVFLEMQKLCKKEFTLGIFFSRMGKISLGILIPPLIAVLYFSIHNAFYEAFRQFYVFNRDVYPNYTNYGTHFFQPFYLAIKNFILVVPSSFNTALSIRTVQYSVLSFLILSFSVVVTIDSFIRYGKKIVLFVPLFVMIMAGSRGYGFHGIPAWNVAVLILILYARQIKFHISVKFFPFVIIGAMYLLSPFPYGIMKQILKEQSQISEIESTLIDATSENEEILIDGWVLEPTYLLAKKRYPANKTLYMLPWYMDWYEHDTIDELKTKKTKFVVFDENSEVWGIKNFSAEFLAVLQEQYTKTETAILWQRNE